MKPKAYLLFKRTAPHTIMGLYFKVEDAKRHCANDEEIFPVAPNRTKVKNHEHNN